MKQPLIEAVVTSLCNHPGLALGVKGHPGRPVGHCGFPHPLIQGQSFVLQRGCTIFPLASHQSPWTSGCKRCLGSCWPSRLGSCSLALPVGSLACLAWIGPLLPGSSPLLYFPLASDTGWGPDPLAGPTDLFSCSLPQKNQFF